MKSCCFSLCCLFTRIVTTGARRVKNKNPDVLLNQEVEENAFASFHTLNRIVGHSHDMGHRQIRWRELSRSSAKCLSAFS